MSDKNNVPTNIDTHEQSQEDLSLGEIVASQANSSEFNDASTENQFMETSMDDGIQKTFFDPVRELRETLAYMRDPLRDIRNSLKITQLKDPMKEVRESLRASQLQDPLKSIRESLKMAQLNDPLKDVRESLRVAQLNNPLKDIRESLKMAQLNDPLKDVRESLRVAQLNNPLKDIRESLKIAQLHDPLKDIRESLLAIKASERFQEIYSSIKALSQDEDNDVSEITIDSDGRISLGLNSIDQQALQSLANDIVDESFSESHVKLDDKVDRLIELVNSSNDPFKNKLLGWIIYPLIVGIILSLLNPITDYYIKRELTNNEKRSAVKEIRAATLSAFEDRKYFSSFKIVSASTLNVREGGSTKSPILGVLHFGDIVAVIEKRRNWTLVSWHDDENNTLIQGWVFTRYLRSLR